MKYGRGFNRPDFMCSLFRILGTSQIVMFGVLLGVRNFRSNNFGET